MFKQRNRNRGNLLTKEVTAVYISFETGFECPKNEVFSYSTITQSLALRPNTSGEYISSALAGGTTKVPGVVARAT